MTNITFYKTNNSFVGFRVSGHSGYAEEGSDIVCAGISVWQLILLIPLILLQMTSSF